MIVEQEGGNAEFAAALRYLFNQNGIAARIASGTAGDTEHRWVIAELGGTAVPLRPHPSRTAPQAAAASRISA